MKLDVGCGDFPTGDVNCDLWTEPNNPHLSMKRTIFPKKIKNFVKCDANLLPFKNKGFSETVCNHVIEHEGVNPIKVIKECVRVTSGVITIRTPHRFFRSRTKLRYFQQTKHDKTFNRTTIEQILTKLGLSAKIDVINEPLLSQFLPFVLKPSEIVVRIPVK